jgi:DNA modification methylase
MAVINQHIDEKFAIYHADCVEGLGKLADNSIHYSVFSPPFSSLYTYSNSDRDMGNSRSHDEFFIHFGFVIKDLFRVIMPGRLVSVHLMNLPTSKTRDGFIGIRDFRGETIRRFVDAGFIYHSEVCVWKNPVVAMQRTKALGLLWKQIKKDSSMCRQGIPDYVVTFRKPGVNPKPISHTAEEFPVDEWQQIASPCWMDINQSNTLNFRQARESEDERHIAPLQLDLIERCLRLWTAPDDIVLSPFAGIGSEGWVSLKKGRRFVGFELKESYFKIAVENLQVAQRESEGLFSKNGACASK